MNATNFPPIPLDTARAARAVFGRSNAYLVIGDQANELLAGLSLENALNSSNRPVHKLFILYLITIFQHLETLPDQLAVDALRERIDWKYALHLPLNPPPLNAFTLCEFRKVIQADPASKQNLQQVLRRLAGIPQVALCPCLGEDAGRVVSHVCRISRLATIWEAINQAIETLAIQQPEWLRTHNLPHWYERYGHIRRTINLRSDPQEQESFAQAIGGDGEYLLETISESGAQELAYLPEFIALQKVWNDQFVREGGKMIWKKDACTSCSLPCRFGIVPGNVSQ